MRPVPLAEKRAWLADHRWLWDAMPASHTREAAGYLSRLRRLMGAEQLYSRKTGPFEIEASLFHQIAHLRKVRSCA